MNDDVVGSPIFFVDNNSASTELDQVFELLSSMVGKEVFAVLTARLKALFDLVEEVNADGMCIAAANDNTLSMYISTMDDDKVIDIPIPEFSLPIKRQEWIIANIQGVSNSLNLVTDPAICQCFCGYAGSVDNWLEVLVPDLI